MKDDGVPTSGLLAASAARNCKSALVGNWKERRVATDPADPTPTGIVP